MSEFWMTNSNQDVPCDFTQYLSDRFRLSHSEAENLLVQWISQYEPRARHPIATSASGDLAGVVSEPLPNVPLSRVA
jgi:hypothetical protein